MSDLGLIFIGFILVGSLFYVLSIFNEENYFWEIILSILGVIFMLFSVTVYIIYRSYL